MSQTSLLVLGCLFGNYTELSRSAVLRAAADPSLTSLIFTSKKKISIVFAILKAFTS